MRPTFVTAKIPCARILCAGIGLGLLVALAAPAPAADSLAEAESPLYRSTLDKAIGELTGAVRQAEDGAPSGQDAAAAPGDSGASFVTQDPAASTACVDGQAYVCTRQPAATTQCGANSNTCCAADPQCVVITTNPPWRTTMCRGANTMCRNNEQVVCTFQSGAPTTCPVSRTFCPGRTPGQGDANCFTFVPMGRATLCDRMQTACNGAQQVVCTRDPMSTTQCTHSSRTRCGPADPICLPGRSVGDPLCLVEPATAQQGATTQIGLFCFDTYLVQGEMHAYFGDDIDVIDYQAISSIESYAQIHVQPGAALGPRLVLVHGGDSPLGSPDAWGEFAIAVGLLDITGSSAVAGEPAGAAATGVRLRSAPNPFSSTTALRYELAAAGRVRVMVFDAAGRLVRRLREGVEAPGEHVVTWDGRNEAGARVPAGVYFSVVETPAETVARKLVLKD